MGGAGAAGPVGWIAQLNPAQETLLDESKLASLAECRVNRRLPTAPGCGQALGVDHALKLAQFVLDPAGALKQMKLAGIETPSWPDIGQDRPPQSLAGGLETLRRLGCVPTGQCNSHV